MLSFYLLFRYCFFSFAYPMYRTFLRLFFVEKGMVLMGVKNKTTIYYMRNELVSTFTDMTHLENMVETRKLRNFLKTFFLQPNAHLN